MQPDTFIPRKNRAEARGIRAAAAARAAGRPAIEIAFASIDATFQSAFWDTNWLKISCERVLRRGVADWDNRGRFFAIAQLVEEAAGQGCPIERAIRCVDVLYRHELRDIDRRHALNIAHSRMYGERLKEARLLLRFLRARGMAGQFPQIFEILTTPLHLPAPQVFWAQEAAE